MTRGEARLKKRDRVATLMILIECEIEKGGRIRTKPLNRPSGPTFRPAAARNLPVRVN